MDHELRRRYPCHGWSHSGCRNTTAEAVRQTARRERRSLSDVGARIMEEWVRQSRFGHIEFRSFNGERHACIKDRLQVWQVIMAARPLAMDVERTAGCLGLMPPQSGRRSPTTRPIQRRSTSRLPTTTLTLSACAACCRPLSGSRSLHLLCREPSATARRERAAGRSDAGEPGQARRGHSVRPYVGRRRLPWPSGRRVAAWRGASRHGALTYDRKTIPPLLASLAAAGRSHAGVVFIDHRTIAPADIGGLARAMIELWDQARQWDWRDRIAFMAASAAPA